MWLVDDTSFETVVPTALPQDELMDRLLAHDVTVQGEAPAPDGTWYVQLPPLAVWGTPIPGAAPEPLDGWFQTPDGEAARKDEEFSYAAAWEFTATGDAPVLHKEDLVFEYVNPTQRSYA